MQNLLTDVTPVLLIRSYNVTQIMLGKVELVLSKTGKQMSAFCSEYCSTFCSKHCSVSGIAMNCVGLDAHRSIFEW